MSQEHSAGAIIFRNENGRRVYLLLHYISGHWDYVKGHIEKGESLEETVKRETMEETGLKDLRFVHGFQHKIQYFFRRGRTTVTKDVVFLLAETQTARVVVSEEHKGYDWQPYAQALEKTTFETAKSVLRKAEEFLNVYGNQKVPDNIR
ncbi:MAG: NUDIX domain-containing protein [Candidatus Aenigmatarchaeota archaeon]|nr:MAG: NUDIX domain-containing protein [Candidatus Aenigmarchaeota archaeon]